MTFRNGDLLPVDDAPACPACAAKDDEITELRNYRSIREDDLSTKLCEANDQIARLRAENHELSQWDVLRGPMSDAAQALKEENERLLEAIKREAGTHPEKLHYVGGGLPVMRACHCEICMIAREEK